MELFAQTAQITIFTVAITLATIWEYSKRERIHKEKMLYLSKLTELPEILPDIDLPKILITGLVALFAFAGGISVIVMMVVFMLSTTFIALYIACSLFMISLFLMLIVLRDYQLYLKERKG
ncbi:MAG: hypothetical protein V1799_16505 [bacterium]